MTVTKAALRHAAPPCPHACSHDAVSWQPVEIQYNNDGTADIDQTGDCVECGATLRLEYEAQSPVIGPCKRCGTQLNNSGFCPDLTCPHSDYLQNQTWTEN